MCTKVLQIFTCPVYSIGECQVNVSVLYSQPHIFPYIQFDASDMGWGTETDDELVEDNNDNVKANDAWDNDTDDFDNQDDSGVVNNEDSDDDDDKDVDDDDDNDDNEVNADDSNNSIQLVQITPPTHSQNEEVEMNNFQLSPLLS